jgi:hypothetical protein
MASLIDIITAAVIGAAIILMIIGLNFYIESSSRDIINSSIAQSNVTNVGSILQFDFYKIGYRVSSNKIGLADSTRILYYSDFDDNSVVDSIYYYLGPTSELTSTPNPNDRLLYRVQNNETPRSSNAGVVDFKLTYYDSTGTKLAYSSLTSQAIRNSIRSIEVYLKIEASSSVEGTYAGIEWKKNIRPKNLK